MKYKIERLKHNVLSWHITLLQKEENMSDVLLLATILFLYAYIDIFIYITGINRSNETNQEVLLQLSNVPKDVPISKISDDDFSEVLIIL